MTSKKLRWWIAGLLVLLNAVWISFFVSVLRSPDIGRTRFLGNWDENIANLPGPESRRDYSFAVIGDSRNGIETFEVLLEKAARAAKPEFAVHLGDFVPHSTPGQYAFFIHEFSEHPDMPLFVIPGNHDVKPSEDKGRLFFEKTMGPRKIWFRYRGDLFVVYGNPTDADDYDLEWLERILSQEARNARNVFVFMHHPIFFIDKKSDTAIVDVKHPLHQIFKKWNVRYVFAGHYHSYIRKEVDGIEYVVTAGGGSPLYGKRAFYHAVLVNVHETQIQETLITSTYRFGLDDEVANLAYRLFYSLYKAQPAAFYALMLLVQALLIWLLVKSPGTIWTRRDRNR